MADVTVANTSPGIEGKTLACHDADGVTTGLWTFTNPLGLKGGLPANQTWRLSVSGNGYMNVLADGTGAGMFLNPAAGVLFTGDIGEKGRVVPLGHWTDFAASLTCDVGTVALTATYACRYMLVGKTVTLSVYLDFTGTGTPHVVSLALPAGMQAAGQNIGAIALGIAGVGYAGVAQTNPSATVMAFTRDIFAQGDFGGIWRVGGTFSFPIL